MVPPIRVLAVSLLAGVLAGLRVVPVPWACAAATAACAVALVAARRHEPRIAALALLTGAALLAGFLRAARTAEGPTCADAVDLACVDAVVVRGADFISGGPDDEPQARETSFRVEVEAPATPRLEVRLHYRDGDDVPALLPGDRVRLVGEIEPLRAPSNPGEPDRRPAMLREGVVGTLHVTAPGAVRVEAPDAMAASTWVCRAGEIGRRAVVTRIREACGGPGAASALLGCLLVGDRSDIDAATADAFRDSGTAHLLSVSGLHVVLLAAAARRAARAVVTRRLRRRTGLPALLALLAVYCALCRFGTPVVRASLFLAVAEIARAAGRRGSPIDSLCLAAAIVLAADPVQALDPGFQLSFAAVAGLALLLRPLRATLFPSLAILRKFPEAMSARRRRLLEAFATSLAASLAASLATAPIVSGVFGRVQPAGPLVNLVAVPVAAVLVPLAAVLALVGGTVSVATTPLARFGAAVLDVAVGAGSRLPCATIETGVPPGIVVAAATTLVVLAAAIGMRRPRRASAAAGVGWLLLCTPLIDRNQAPPEIVALDVGHGLCVLVRAGGDGGVLFDAGGHSTEVGRHAIVPALRALGVRRLAAIVVSHEDWDHCGAVADVLDAVPVGEVLVAPGFGAAPTPRALVAKCRAAAVPVSAVCRGERRAWRGVALEVLHPFVDLRDASDNRRSVVVSVVAGRGDDAVSALMTGDLEGPPLDALIADPTAPRVAVLLLPHHGRGDPATHLALARRVGAEVLVASTSETAPMSVPGAVSTGRRGALRIRAGAAVVGFPWPGNPAE